MDRYDVKAYLNCKETRIYLQDTHEGVKTTESANVETTESANVEKLKLKLRPTDICNLQNYFHNIKNLSLYGGVLSFFLSFQNIFTDYQE